MSSCQGLAFDIRDHGSDAVVMLSGADNAGNVGSIFRVLEGNCTN